METFSEILNYSQLQSHISSPTIPFHVLINNTNSLIDEELLIWNSLQDRPRIVGSQLKDLKYRREVFNYFIYIILISGTISSFWTSFNLLLHKRRDKSIFIGRSHEINNLLSDETFQTLGFKIAYSIDAKIIWVDYPIYREGKMMPIRDISNRPWTNPTMGERLRGRFFKTAAFEAPPHYFKWSDGIDGKLELEGTYHRVIKDISRAFNFSYSIEYAGNNAGRLLKNGTWEGLLAYTIYPELGYHFSFHLMLFMYHGLMERPSYGQVFAEDKFIFITQHGRFKLPWYTFLQSFEPDVWILTGIMFFATCLVQFIVMYLRAGFKIKNLVIDAGFFIPFAMVMEQGLQNIPKGVRYFSCLLLLAGTILGTGYKSTLRTNLVFPQKEKIPTSYLDLIQREEYKLTFLVMSVEPELAKGTPYFSALERRLTFLDTHKEETSHFIRRAFMTQEKSAFLYWTLLLHSNIDRFVSINQHLEPMFYSKDHMLKFNVATAFTHQSIIADSFMGPIYGAIEGGLFQHYVKVIRQRSIKKGSDEIRSDPSQKKLLEKLQELEKMDDQHRIVPLSVSSLKLVIGLVPIGLIISGIFFLFEICPFDSHLFKLFFVRIWNNLINSQNNVTHSQIIHLNDFNIN